MSTDPLMVAVWREFLLWAIEDPSMRQGFHGETGLTLPEPNRAPIEVMIDAATGYQDATVFAFAKWATVEHFGLEYAPKAFRAACRVQP